MPEIFEWKDEYSVGVKLIDDQHKHFFQVINELLDTINKNDPQRLNKVIEGVIEYKKNHFATEEKYFKEFDYENTEEHIKLHHGFDIKINELRKEFHDNNIEFAFALIDFLEDWLISHIMYADQKYKECFLSHGLK